jgi:hypothetical protein
MVLGRSKRSNAGKAPGRLNKPALSTLLLSAHLKRLKKGLFKILREIYSFLDIKELKKGCAACKTSSSLYKTAGYIGAT